MSISYKTEVINIDNGRRINVEIILNNPGGLPALKFAHYVEFIGIQQNKKDVAINIRLINNGRPNTLLLDSGYIYAPYIPIMQTT